MRSDNGKEFNNIQIDELCDELGIKHEFSSTYTPQQNGVVERRNRMVVEMARCMLAHKNLPYKFWAEAVNTAVYILNRCPTKAVENETPYEVWYKRKPEVRTLRIF